MHRSSARQVLALCTVLTLLGMCIGGCRQADEARPIRVAVAANFAETLRALGARYEDRTGQALRISVGSTGSLFSQIEHGAPVDIFFAADSRRPAMLVERGLAAADTRRTYALGELLLWSADAQRFPEQTILDVLADPSLGAVAMANPETAPYGLAAQQVLQALDQWDAMQARLVQAQSIGQAYQFVQSGAATCGFVARAQVQGPGHAAGGSQLRIDPALYDPIEQQVVVLTPDPAVLAFWRWITEDAHARARIAAAGYALP